ncbi:MAG TPA: type II toxin-antitoxin system VapC family toxin [Micromonosporaceae bacterium]|nr:type II toxin-antitoxin system VapC family toxin [Micromonosporaceae bacterium]
MAYLLDTNVVSELRKITPNLHVLAWRQSQRHAEAYISTLVVGEIRQGIERVRPRDPVQADALERWLVGLVPAYRDRILPVTVAIAEEWGRLNALPRPLPVVDGLMAATAKVHGLTFVTRNVSDVARAGVKLLNPFEAP